eukprot:8447582-Pyramimonas_sp.AAC.1
MWGHLPPMRCQIHSSVMCWAAWNSSNNDGRQRARDTTADRALPRAGGWTPHRGPAKMWTWTK